MKEFVEGFIYLGLAELEREKYNPANMYPQRP